MIVIDHQWRLCFSREHTLATPIRLIGWARHPRALANGLLPHRHNGAFELHLLKRGRLDLVVQSGVFNLRAGHLFITRPDEVHCGVGNTLQQSEYFFFQVNHDQIGDTENEILERLVSERVLRFDPIALRLADDLLQEHVNKDQYSRDRAAALFRLFIVQLARCMEPDFYSPSDAVATAMRLLRQQVGSPPKLAQLAREARLSPTSLSVKFREEVGESIAKWFLHERLDHACRLILEGCSTRQIAEVLGYSTPQNFATTFRRELGTTPSGFRELFTIDRARALPEDAPAID